MLKATDLRDNQRKAVLHQLYNQHSMLWLECGFGKTPVTLTSIEALIRSGQVQKVLVFGPVRVIHAVWEREARKWEHTRHLRFSIVGWPNEKRRLRGIGADADIYLCNYENMGWLSSYLTEYYVKQDKPLPFQMVVYDEVTKVKNSQSVRIKGGSRERVKNRGKANEIREKIRINGWRNIIPHIPFTTGLTGSPASNGYTDLHGQYLCVDGGQRLGQYVTAFREAYCTQDYNGFNYSVSDTAKKWIDNKISDITLYIPPNNTRRPTINDIMVDLPDKVMQQYREVEKDMFTRLDDGTEIELFNRASVSNKCLQFASGAPYKVAGDSSEWSELHDAKLEALDSVIEEANGKTILLGYSFKSDAERIMKRYKSLNPVNLTKTKPEDFTKVLEQGNRGEIKLMIGHAASLGHGVDGLNDFCQIICWFGLPWSLELYEQLIGRIASGERFKKPVTIHRIMATGTLDVAVADALLRKDSDQNGLKKSIQRYRDGLVSKDGLPSFI